MLKAVARLDNGLTSKKFPDLRRLLRQRVLPAHISTNTAINKSLRRSQHDNQRPERRRTDILRRPAQDFASTRRQQYEGRGFENRMSGPDAPHERRPRPNHQQGMDVEDVRESSSFNKLQRSQRRLRKPLRRNEKGEFDRSTRGAKYDYESNPKGNRALRRALKFDHPLEPAVLDQSAPTIRRAAHHVSEQDLFDSAPSNLTTRRPATPMRRGGPEIAKSMTEDMKEHYMSRFSMRRPLDRPDRASNFSRSRGKDYPLEGYRRDPTQNDDEQTPYRDINVPLSVPYTTPASEFLYGTSVVTAALLSSRRKLYKMYIYAGENREDIQQDKKIREIALDRGVVVERVMGDWLRLMDKMSQRRPHNGYILEASPLPKLPVTGFRAVAKHNEPFHVILDHQSREDEAVNGTNTNIKYGTSFPRYPFVLLLDGILDPGNLGAILRSAFFLGVDAVAISNRSSAPVSPVAIKASAGASEALPLVSVRQPGNFIDQCKGSGWKVFAAAAPAPGKRIGLGNYLSSSNLGNPIQNHPCVLILGGEGEGLHWNLRRKADFDVGIDGPRIGQGGVDSLNVSVAGGLLCEAFLRRPMKGNRATSRSNSAKTEVDNRVF